MEQKQKAFLQAYETCHEKFMKYCTVLGNSKMDTDDLVQDVLLSAYKNFDNIENKDKLLHYLIRAARNRAITTWKKNKRHLSITDTEYAQMASNQLSPEIGMEIYLLYKALDKLPKKQKEAILLFEVNGFSMKEIAELQNSSEGAIKNQIWRGRKKLRRIMSEKTIPLVILGVTFSMKSFSRSKPISDASLSSSFKQLEKKAIPYNKSEVIQKFQSSLSSSISQGTQNTISQSFNLFPSFSKLGTNAMLSISGILVFSLYSPTKGNTIFNRDIAEIRLDPIVITAPRIKKNTKGNKMTKTIKNNLEDENIQIVNVKNNIEIKSNPSNIKIDSKEKIQFNSQFAEEKKVIKINLNESQSIPIKESVILNNSSGDLVVDRNNPLKEISSTTEKIIEKKEVQKSTVKNKIQNDEKLNAEKISPEKTVFNSKETCNCEGGVNEIPWKEYYECYSCFKAKLTIAIDRDVLDPEYKRKFKFKYDENDVLFLNKIEIPNALQEKYRKLLSECPFFSDAELNKIQKSRKQVIHRWKGYNY